jgi:hypothetical protein
MKLSSKTTAAIALVALLAAARIARADAAIHEMAPSADPCEISCTDPAAETPPAGAGDPAVADIDSAQPVEAPHAEKAQTAERSAGRVALGATLGALQIVGGILRLGILGVFLCAVGAPVCIAAVVAGAVVGGANA